MSKWALTVAENFGEIDNANVTEEIRLPIAPLLTDMKAQLMLVPKNFTYRVGWKAIVWQNTETGQFKELTEDEFRQYLAGDTIAYTRDSDEGTGTDEPTSGSEGQTGGGDSTST